MLLPSFGTALVAACLIASTTAAIFDDRATEYQQARYARRMRTLSARQGNGTKGNGQTGSQGTQGKQAANQGGNNGAAAAAAKTKKPASTATKKAAAAAGTKKPAATAAKATPTKAANGNAGNSNNNNNNNNNNNGGTAGAAGDLCVKANAVATGSAATGQNGAAAAGQVASLTDSANFINFCSGKTITNGLQTKGGSCNPIPMGDIPSNTNMISSIIVSPKPGEEIKANTDFSIDVQTANLVAGSFTNPDSTYYSAPQQLQGGKVVGHTHVTVQDLGNSLEPTKAPDAATFAFFKGINDKGDGKGLLSTDVTGGLPAGNYRVCTMSSASNHQAVLMPVAQRGAQDDCQKFTIK